MSGNIRHYLERYQHRVNNCLHQLFAQEPQIAPRLTEAMRYSLFANGKRIRPVLAYAAAEAITEVNDTVDLVACALECIHTYSLIHDDLPAMDDDDLRRGAPTCHIAFDEATAILAGDGLQALAFDILSRPSPIAAESQVKLVSLLAQASGSRGMVAGQSLDLNAVGKKLQLPALETVHRYKTGALIRASVVMGAVATGQCSPDQETALDNYAQAIGLAFQVQDDILDVTGDTTALGKQAGADAALDKPTYVSILGLDASKALLTDLHRESVAALSAFGERAEPLRQLADYIVDRAN